jgi:polysaccharide chain length determinant protein (PEP-CTERM system associated)
MKLMSESAKKIKPEQIIEIILKRHWFIIIPFCISMIVGTVLVIKLPRIYESKTVILVQAQKVPSNIVQDIVSSDINARISTLSQQILSRSNLEKIIKDFDLYSDSENKNMFLEKKVEDLVKRITVKVTQGGGKNADSFSISFRGTDPEKVMRVTTSLASSFIDENLKIRESQAIGTNTFLEDELESMRKRLSDNEQKLKQYRESNMGGLPEQLDSNLKMLDNLNQRLTATQEGISSAMLRVSSIDKPEYEQTPVVTSNSSNGVSNLSQLKDQLEVYRNKYTENHPDVVRLKKMIADMESQLKKNKGKDVSTSDRKYSANSQRLDSEYNKQRRNAQNEVNRLEMEKAGIIKQIAIYKKRVEDTPKREEELQSLERDYHNIDQTYNSLLGRQLEAQMAVNMEKKQKGEQFRILDPASLPQSPVDPDMRKLFIFIMALGLGVGGGIIFLLEFLDLSFKDPEDIETFLNIPVIATIPTVFCPDEINRNHKKMILSISGLVISVILFAIFLGLIIIKR